MKLPKLKLPLRLLLYTVTIILSVLSILEVCFGYVNDVIGSIIYGLAACGIGAACCYLYHDLHHVINKKVKPGIVSNPFTNRVTKDYRYRAVLFTYSSLAINLLFACGNGIFRIRYHSVWFGTLSAYYIVLSMMRFSVVSYERRVASATQTQELRRQELSVYRNCGILFILLTLALGVSVIQMVYFDQGKHYPGMLIYVVAMYTFYKITLAVINVIKVRKLKSPLLVAIRNIGYADALVSLLSLQTAMFVSFGADDGASPGIMNSITGGCVCFMIMIMGICMVVSPNKQKQCF